MSVSTDREARQVAERMDSTFEALKRKGWNDAGATKGTLALAEGGFFNTPTRPAGTQ